MRAAILVVRIAVVAFFGAVDLAVAAGCPTAIHTGVVGILIAVITGLKMAPQLAVAAACSLAVVGAGIVVVVVSIITTFSIIVGFG